MGADNWAICPRCQERVRREIKAREQAAIDAYGRVPVDEWKALDNAAKIIPEPEYQFREDYEIGVHEGQFSINYRGSCRVCDLSVSFVHEETVA